MKKIRLITSAIAMGAALFPAVTMAAGHNAADARRADAANLPVCSSKTTGDCHIHSRDVYLDVRPDLPDATTQAHAWWEYEREQKENAELSRD